MDLTFVQLKDILNLKLSEQENKQLGLVLDDFTDAIYGEQTALTFQMPTKKPNLRLNANKYTRIRFVKNHAEGSSRKGISQAVSELVNVGARNMPEILLRFDSERRAKLIQDRLWALAFVVGDAKGEIKAAVASDFPDPVSVFVPTVPNPTSGFLIYVSRAEMKTLKMSIEDAAKLVFSLGLVVPEGDDADEAVKKLEAMAGEAKAKKPIFMLGR